MLKSSNRIKQKEFQVFFKSGKSIHAPLFTLVYGVQTQKTLILQPKCSVVVPKTVAKKAVDRNKIRRRVYGILRKNQKTLKNKGFYIFLTKKPIITASFVDITEACLGAISKITI